MPKSSSAAFCPTCCPRASCGSATSAFWPIALKNKCCLNAANSSALIPLCPKCPKNQPRTCCRSYRHRSVPLSCLPKGHPGHGSRIAKNPCLGLFMKRTQPILSPFNSQPSLFPRVCLQTVKTCCNVGSPKKISTLTLIFAHHSISGSLLLSLLHYPGAFKSP